MRFALLDAVIAAKGGGPLDQQAWDGAFGQAVRSIRLRVLAEAEQMLRAAAAHSHFPSRRLQAMLPDADAADSLLNRLLAEGMPLEKFAGLGDDPVSRRARGAALEAAWEGAVRVAERETGRWRATAAQVESWRRPTTLLWIVSIAVILLAGLLAGWLSGEVPAPEWFRPINDFWWRLWP